MKQLSYLIIFRIDRIYRSSSKMNSQSAKHHMHQKRNVTKRAVNVTDELPSYLPNKLHDSKIAALNATITTTTDRERAFNFVRLHHWQKDLRGPRGTKTPLRR